MEKTNKYAVDVMKQEAENLERLSMLKSEERFAVLEFARLLRAPIDELSRKNFLSLPYSPF